MMTFQLKLWLYVMMDNDSKRGLQWMLLIWPKQRLNLIP